MFPGAASEAAYQALARWARAVAPVLGLILLGHDLGTTLLAALTVWAILTAAGEEVLAAIVEDTGEFVGEAPQFDDMTMLLLEITEEDTGRMQADDDQRSGIKQRGAEYERSEVLPEKGGYTMATKKELISQFLNA